MKKQYSVTWLDGYQLLPLDQKVAIVADAEITTWDIDSGDLDKVLALDLFEQHTFADLSGSVLFVRLV